MNTPEKTTSERAELQAQRVLHRATSDLEFIQTYRTAIDRIGKAPYLCGDCFDFDHLERPALLEVIRAFPGKWDKSPGYNGGIVYTRREPILGNLKIRIYNGEPPAACIIEEKVEYVKVPERIERRVTRTVRCPEPTNEAALNNNE